MNRLLAVTAVLSLTLSPLALAQTQNPQTQNPQGGSMSGTMPNSGMQGSDSGNMPSSTGSMSGSSASAHVTPDMAKQVQSELKSQGLYKGAVDGKIGPQTKAALASYQKSKGLQQTRTIDQQTLNSLHGEGSSGSSQQQ